MNTVKLRLYIFRLFILLMVWLYIPFVKGQTKSTDTTIRGFLPPRLTISQMNGISNPPEGLTVYNTTLKTLCWFNGTSWEMATNHDGNECGDVNYPSVIIGMQCWMRSNLKTGIGILSSTPQTNNLQVEKYCYNNDPVNCTNFGGLYTWNEMMNYTPSSNSNPSGKQGICPSGWHIPSNTEFCQLLTYLDPTINCASTTWAGTDAGGKMKEPGTINWAFPNIGASEASLFRARGAGLFGFLGFDNTLYYKAYFWTSTEDQPQGALMVELTNNSAQVIPRAWGDKSIAVSVRCVKD